MTSDLTGLANRIDAAVIEERAANDRSSERVFRALEPLDEIVCLSFYDSPVSCARPDLWGRLASYRAARNRAAGIDPLTGHPIR